MNGSAGSTLASDDDIISDGVVTLQFDYDQKTFQLVFNLIISGAVAIFGATSNFVSVIVFVKLGLTTSMSVGIFVLSLNDLVFSTFMLASCMCYLANVLIPNCQIDLYNLGGFVFGCARNALYLCSCWITTVISLERCFCVVCPFAVKRIFTKTRCVFVIVLIYLVILGLHACLVTGQRMDWRHLINQDCWNCSEKFSKFWTLVEEDNSARTIVNIIVDFVVGMCMSIVFQITLIVCNVWMIYSLTKSSHVRRNNDAQFTGESDISQTALSLRERRLIKIVVLLSVLLTVCNIPRLCFTVLYYTVPGMTTEAYLKINTFLWEISSFICSLSCFGNFFIYYVLNSKYREQCRILFRPKSKDSEKIVFSRM